MTLPEELWCVVKAKLDPDAWRDLVEDVAGDDDLRLDQVLSKAVELHHAYTGATISFKF